MKVLFKHGLILALMLITPLSAAYANKAEIEELRSHLLKYMPQAADAIIKPTPLEGLCEVTAGTEIMYMNKNARYVIDGNMLDMKTKTNLTENARSGIRLKAVNALGEENMLVYMPDGKVKHTITIFTDIYCPYCRKLHDEMGDYKKNGIKVRYIFVPFKGKKSVDASVSVWCAEDKNLAMDMAKSGAPIDYKTCTNPVKQHQALAAQISIRGTPAIMLESGTLLPGYVPSAKLIQQLNAGQ